LEIRLAIVDDKPVNRLTIREKLSAFSEMQIVLEAVNGEDFLSQLKAFEVEKRPQVILVDLEMPRINGIQTIALAAPAYPELKFIVLTVFEDNEKIFEAIKAGAHGYLLKDEKAISITEAINQVIEYDAMPMSPVIARKAIDMFKNGSQPLNEDQSKFDETLLSDREMDILKELSTGKSYKTIGEKLFISPFTVRKHVSNIYNKLHVDNRIQVINVAKKNKWV
jgi:DNA-binding NarL/FixJ family response regulator